jgi:Holliday junction DNA helicase RuvA
LIELKGRLNLPMLDGITSAGSASSVAQVREALVGLGYGHDEIRDTLRELDGSLDAERLLRDALNLLGARRA